MRFGTRTDLKRRWTPQAHRPKAPVQIGYQFCYLYVALCPFTGQAFAMLMPQMSKDCFRLFIELFDQHIKEQHLNQQHLNQQHLNQQHLNQQHLNQQHLSRPTLLITDRATTHQSKLTEHTQIVLTHLPTACPELNPVERFFKQMRQHLANMIFASLEHAQNKVIEVFEKLTQSTEKISQLTLFPYIQNTHS